MEKECYNIFRESLGRDCHVLRLIVIRDDDKREVLSYRFDYQRINGRIENAGEALTASDIVKMLPQQLQSEAWRHLNRFSYVSCLSMKRKADAIEHEYIGL